MFCDKFADYWQAVSKTMRIITTTCSNTEIVDALGCGNQIIAVDDYSDYPPKRVAGLPRVGPDLGIDVDKVVDLKPDLVLASLTVPGHEKVVASLQEAGLNVFAPETIGLDDVYRDIDDIARLLDVPARGTELRAQMQAEMPPCDTTSPAASLMVQWWPKPIIAAARKSWIHDLIELAGGSHAMADVSERSTPLEDSDEVLRNADAWVISWCGVEVEKYRPQVLYDRKSLSHCKAVKHRQIFCISEAFLGRPSPRLIGGYQALKEVLQTLIWPE